MQYMTYLNIYIYFFYIVNVNILNNNILFHLQLVTFNSQKK